VRRALLALAVLAIAVVAVYWFALRGSSTTDAEAQPPRAVAQIGEGKRVTVVGGDGRLMGSASGKSKTDLPVLSLKERPKGDRVRGHVREEVLVLAAAPKALGRYVARADYGKTGVEVEFASGIEIRFGDAHRAAKKWKAAATVLADPSVTALSYVDVHAPTRPAVEGQEHELPPAS
jgi:cell division septal protein FtsQ